MLFVLRGVRRREKQISPAASALWRLERGFTASKWRLAGRIRLASRSLVSTESIGGAPRYSHRRSAVRSARIGHFFERICSDGMRDPFYDGPSGGASLDSLYEKRGSPHPYRRRSIASPRHLEPTKPGARRAMFSVREFALGERPTGEMVFLATNWSQRLKRKFKASSRSSPGDRWQASWAGSVASLQHAASTRCRPRAAQSHRSSLSARTSSTTFSRRGARGRHRRD